MAKKLKIITVPAAVLRRKSSEVEATSQVKKLIKRMKALLIDERGELSGIGLSAPQVGFNWRLFVTINDLKKPKPFRVFINPVIYKSSSRLTDGVPEAKFKYEGCLSIPGVYGLVRRPAWVKLKYLTIDEEGQVEERDERFDGLLATIIQHEYDHLEGILFVDRVKEQGEKLYRIVTDESGREVLEEIEVGEKLEMLNV
ncbi:MAG: peptide deformylase [bacterium]|nr:peptide deformylase [bacterium]